MSGPIIQRLRQRSGSALDVSLPTPDELDVPVRIDEEALALRNLSDRYQVFGVLGRGGVGTVLQGRDLDLGRDVAIKVLREEYADRPDVLARFVEEAQVGGQLQHPGIVPVFGLGLREGRQPFFAMKLVRGETFAERLNRRQGPADDLFRHLQTFAQVCQTVAYAHDRHTVHRDLKPANVMVGAFGEVQVVDWGFAKVLSQSEAARARERGISRISTVRSGDKPGTASVTGSVLGTPAYMPPEQARGEVELVDERSDVFALGAILCEVLSGAPPYREADGDLLRQASQAALGPARERLAASGAPAPLQDLVRFCLEEEQARRPQNAQVVADALTGYLAAVEDQGHRARLQAVETGRRQRLTLVYAAFAVLLVGLILTTTWVLGARAETTERRLRARLAGMLDQVSELAQDARAQGSWKDSWLAAEAAAEQIAALLPQLRAGDPLHEQVAGLRRSLATERDAAAEEQAERRRLQELTEALDACTLDGAEQLDWRAHLQQRRRGITAALTRYCGGSLDEARLRASRAAAPAAAALCVHRLLGKLLDDAGSPETTPDWIAKDCGVSWLWQRRVGKEQLLAAAKTPVTRAVDAELLGHALVHAGEQAAAVRFLEVALESWMDSYALQALLGLCHELAPTADPTAAAHRYEIAAILRAGDLSPRLRRAFCLRRAEQTESAVTVLRRAAPLLRAASTAPVLRQLVERRLEEWQRR